MQLYKRGAAVIGALTLLTGLTIGGVYGTKIDGHYRTTASINVNSLAGGGTTSSAVTLNGAATGDHCVVSVTGGDFISGSTSTGIVRCVITASNTATLYFYNATTSAAFNPATSTFSLQAWSY